MGKHKKKSKKSNKHKTHSESSDEWEEAPLETATETLQGSRSKAHAKMKKPTDDYDDDELPSSRKPSRPTFTSEKSYHSRSKDHPSWRKRDHNQKHRHAFESNPVPQSKQNDPPTGETELSLDNKQVDSNHESTSDLILSKSPEPSREAQQSSEKSMIRPEMQSKDSAMKEMSLDAKAVEKSFKSTAPESGRKPSDSRKAIERHDDETPEILSNDKMNKLSAKILKAELKGDIETAQRLKLRLDSATKARLAADQSGEQDSTTVVVITKDKPHSSDGAKRSWNKADRRAERKKMRLEDDWQFLENKFVRKKVEEDEATNAALQRAKRVMEVGTNPTEKDDMLDDVHSGLDPRQCVIGKIVKDHSSSETHSNVCPFCVDSAACVKHLIIHEGKNSTLMLPQFESLSEFHCLIVPKEHLPALTLADDDTWSEIQELRQTLTKMFAIENMDCVFLQTVTELSRRSHAFIHCIPISTETAEMMPMYFKKAIEECETEWTMNKKLVRLSKEGVRACIPKGLPYFAVDFGEENGFGHVIEDRTRFPEYFGLEIIGNILDVSPSVWLKPRRESFATQSKKVLSFEGIWSKHGGTKNLGRLS